MEQRSQELQLARGFSYLRGDSSRLTANRSVRQAQRVRKPNDVLRVHARSTAAAPEGRKFNL